MFAILERQQPVARGSILPQRMMLYMHPGAGKGMPVAAHADVRACHKNELNVG